MKNTTYALIFLLLNLIAHLPNASAQIVMGSSLASAPNIGIDCAVQPVLDQNFNFVPATSGTADCTWRQSGVFGVLSGDSRFSSVPGDGIITTISVRSGPNPAPLRFSILRQLSTPGFGGEGQCCFFVGETPEVQPVPNTISTFTVNLPVQRNVINGFFAVDLLAVSARAGAGTLPLLSTTGGVSNAFQLTTFGSVNAGFFYPRVGVLPNDVGGGRRETAIPGIELLVQWTWIPSGLGGLGGNVGASVSAQNALVNRQRAEINVACGGNAVCSGVLQLLSGIPVGGSIPGAAGTRQARVRARVKNYGQARYRISGNQSRLVKVKLNKNGIKALRSGSVQAFLRIKPRSGQAQTINMFLVKR